MSGTNITTDVVTTYPAVTSSPTTTGGVTTRQLGSIITDKYNIKNLGVYLDGTSDDAARIQTAYNEVPSGATINLPQGNWYGAPTPNTSNSVFWNALGTLDNGTSSPGTNPVYQIGDSDVFASFRNGSYAFSKTYTSSTYLGPQIGTSYATGGAPLAVFMTNNNPSFSNYAIPYGFYVNANSMPGCGGSTWGLVTILNSSAALDLVQQDVATTSLVYRSGSATTFALSLGSSDSTGVQTDANSIYSVEMDVFANGPDPSSGRQHVLYNNAVKTWNNWTANTNYNVGDVIQQIPSGVSEPCTYVCTVAGKSNNGTSNPKPAWTKPVYPLTATFTEVSGLTWKYGTTVRGGMDRGVIFATSTNSGLPAPANTFNNAIWADCSVNNAFIDCTPATLNGNAKAITLAQNQAIDFSALVWPNQWKASHTYNVGDTVIPNDPFRGAIYVCIASTGSTGSSEPPWTTPPSTASFTDGGATWQIATYGRRFSYSSSNSGLLYAVSGTVTSNTTVKALVIKDDGELITPYADVASTGAVFKTGMVDSAVIINEPGNNPTSITIPDGHTWYVFAPTVWSNTSLSVMFPSFVANGQNLEITFYANISNLSFTFPSGSGSFRPFPTSVSSGQTLKFRALSGVSWFHITYV